MLVRLLLIYAFCMAQKLVYIVRNFVMFSVEQLLAMLKSNVARRVPTIVFCNKSKTACFLGYFLNTNNIHHVCLHGNMPEMV